MSAPQIPNLLTSLRASRASRAGRSERHGDSAGQEHDRVVQQTDDDAAGSRLSAVQLGYINDPFASAFSPSQELVRRMPIINRGTYVRTTAIDRLIAEFLDKHQSKKTQIISLGAGTDTRLFRLIDEDPSLGETLHYHEIDFPSTTSKKIKAIESSPSLLSLLKLSKAGSSNFHIADAVPQISTKHTLLAQSFSLHGIDLRQLASSSPPQLASISATTPTLILSECCLTYLPSHTSHAVLSHLVSVLLRPTTYVQILLYEPLHPLDAFGRTMTSNLSARGIRMPGLEAYPTIEAHRNRLRDLGFGDVQEGWEIKDIWDRWITREDKESLRRLEMVDEEEEWMLLASHYGVIRAIRSGERKDERRQAPFTS